MWFLIWCDDDNSYSIIHKDFVLTGGAAVAINCQVTFFYGNKPYVGKITEMDEDRDVVDKQLKALGATAKRTSKKADDTPAPATTLLHRTRHQASANPQPKEPPTKKHDNGKLKGSSNLPSTGPKNRKIFEMNKNISIQRENKNLLKEIKQSSKKKSKQSSDDEWSPEEQHSLRDLAKQDAKEKKRETQNIIKGIRQLEKDTNANEVISCQSPTKEELRQKLADTEAKLKFIMYEAQLERNSDPDITAREKGSTVKDFQLPITPAADNEESQPHLENDPKVAPVLSPKGIFEDFDDKDGNADDKDAKANDSVDQNSSVSTLNSTLDEIDHDFELSKEQLFGEREDTVKIGPKIFCKKEVLKGALNGSTEVTHLARRLIEGVFKKDAILSCTLTGMPYRAGGKDNIAQVDGLNVLAVRTIISYAKEIGKIRGWPSCKTRTIRTSMTQRLGEIKRRKN